MSLVCGCCTHCGRMSQYLRPCPKCHIATYCTLKCRMRDDPIHNLLCGVQAAPSSLVQDVALAIQCPQFTLLLQALHEYWDPFHLGYIQCAIYRHGTILHCITTYVPSTYHYSSRRIVSITYMKYFNVYESGTMLFTVNSCAAAYEIVSKQISTCPPQPVEIAIDTLSAKCVATFNNTHYLLS